MTLTEIAYQIAGAFERQTDLLFISRIKDLVISSRSMLIHREINKYGINDLYLQEYNPTLIEVNASTVNGLVSKKTLLRSTNKIPTPIRYISDAPFYFAGSADRRVAFRYSKSFIGDFTPFLPFIGNGIEYFWSDGYFYIPNNTKVTNALLIAPYASLNLTNDVNTGICYDDTLEFPLSMDQQNAVIQDVINLLRSGNDLKEKATTTTRDLQ